MRKIKKLLTSAIVLFATASCVFAAETATKIEAYAHPSMFGSQAQETATADATYIVGGKIAKDVNKIGVANKDYVLVESWAKDVMSLIKDKETAATGKEFDVKMPVLRSELAVILAEGLGLNNTNVSRAYTDITSTYWAKDWIYKALNAGVMIGYPDKAFRPDQPVTKAEVFATIAQIINVATDKSLLVPQFNGKDIQYIPRWAIPATKEVVASSLLDSVPDKDRVNNDEYLSKEQVAYLVGALRQDWATGNKIGRDSNAADCIKNYAPVVLNIALEERLSARTSNVGDTFRAKTTKDVTIQGNTFPAGSIVKGEVVEVARPGIKNPGYIKIKFLTLKNGENCVDFPANISQAQADTMKNPNFIARLFGFPLSGAGRVVGVVGRSGASAVNVAGNGLEQLGDNLSNTFVNTLSFKPVSGLRSFGNGFITVGKGVYNICKLAVSGTFGVLYEVTDEIRYLIIPSYSNASSLNPGEELTIVF